MLEDELRQLFAEEAESRLDRLAHQLLELENAADDDELVASVFRDAHTIKGSAGVVGLPDVAGVAHAMEDILEGFRSHERQPTATLVDGLLRAVDGLRSVIPRVLTGDDVAGELTRLEADLRAVGNEGAAGTAGDGKAEPAADAGGRRAESAAAAGSAEVPTPPWVPDRRSADVDVVRVSVSRLDELVRLVSESAAASLRLRRALEGRLDGGAGNAADVAGLSELQDLSQLLGHLHEQTMQARMVPIGAALEPVRRAARELSRAQDKDVRWELRGGDTELDRGVLDQLGDALIQLIRNAIDHGIEPANERAAAGKPIQATIRLHAMQLGSEVVIAVTDDGRGLDLARLRTEATRLGADTEDLTDDETLELAFGTGVSTAASVTQVSGRGVGLDVVRAALRAVRGRVEVHSTPGLGAEFRMIVPITLAVLPCLIVAAGSSVHAVPMHSIVTVLAAGGERTLLEGQPAVWLDEMPVPIADLGALLGAPAGAVGPSLVLTSLAGRHAFQVDDLIGQRDVVVKALPGVLPRLDVIAGASIEPDGSILSVLDPLGLVERARRGGAAVAAGPGPADLRPGGSHILVVDDALTVRELQRSILERAGYTVRTASDGAEALSELAVHPVDLVLTDIEMPRMDGFQLTKAIRASDPLANIAVLILTSRASDDDRRRGLEAGADGYIVKSGFDESGLLDAVARALGRPEHRQ